MFDWGWDFFAVTDQPFILDRANKQFLVNDQPVPQDKMTWVTIEYDRFHEITKSSFSGQMGFSSHDSVFILESSGIRVELVGTENYGPRDPDAFMDEVRARVSRTVATADDCS